MVRAAPRSAHPTALDLGTSASGRSPSRGGEPCTRRLSEELAERIADPLDVPITAAGVIFLLFVLAETISDPQGRVGTVFSITSWVL